MFDRCHQRIDICNFNFSLAIQQQLEKLVCATKKLTEDDIVLKENVNKLNVELLMLRNESYERY